MCEWGNTVEFEVTVPARLSYTGEARQKRVGIDSCIAGIVRALNDGGTPTIQSCCGHGHLPGRITLADGRELVVLPDFDSATEFFRGYGVDIHGEQIERNQR